MKLARSNAIIAMTPYGNSDYRNYAGFPVAVDLGENTAILCGDSVGEIPIGVITEGAKAPEKVSVAIAAGGLAGTVRVKLLAPVTAPGVLLKLVITVAGVAFGPDNGSGERIVMAQALETGAAGELIEAVLFKPLVYAS